jgi:PAS domain S-box-containing protein
MVLPSMVQINYAIRTAAFAWSFFVVGLVFLERGAGALAWTAMSLQFLVYPHLVRAVAALAPDPARVERAALYLDPLLLGAWVASLGFPTWIAYAALFSTVLNNVVVRGLQGGGVAAVWFVVGALLWVAPMDVNYRPATSTLVTSLCFLGSLAYSCGVGLVAYQRSRRLRKARATLQESERRYRLIAEHAAGLVALVDRNGRFLYASPSYARIFRTEDIAVGVDAFRNLHEEDQFRVRGALQVVVRSGESCRMRMRLHTVAGDVRRFETMVHPVREASGEPGGEESGPVSAAVLASRDVTELRDREEQLEIAAHAFERMAEGMFITNASGRILMVNQSYTRITGYAPEEVIGRQETEFRSAMQPPSFYDELYGEVLRQGRWEGTTWCRRRDGTVYREWRSVSAVRDPEERVTHFVALFRELDSHGAGVRPAKQA